MDTLWKNRRAGDGVRLPGVEDISEELGERGGALLISTGVPDWVRHPQTGAQLRVLGVRRVAACPKCRRPVSAEALSLEGNVSVLDCPHGCGYVWWTTRGGP